MLLNESGVGYELEGFWEIWRQKGGVRRWQNVCRRGWTGAGSRIAGRWWNGRHLEEKAGWSLGGLI